MDTDNYDEFGNYIGPELDDTDSDEEIDEHEPEMVMVPTGVEIEGSEEVEEDESMQVGEQIFLVYRILRDSFFIN
jgi:U5 small nuclear ribonucleoprotein component